MNIRQIWRQCRFDRLKLQLYVSLGSCMGKVVYMWLARGILSSIRSFWTTPFGLRMLWGLGIDSLDDKWRTNNLIGNISIASIRILVPVRVWLFTLEKYLEELSFVILNDNFRSPQGNEKPQGPSMKTPWHGKVSICEGNPKITCNFSPFKGPIIQSFDVA